MLRTSAHRRLTMLAPDAPLAWRPERAGIPGEACMSAEIANVSGRVLTLKVSGTLTQPELASVQRPRPASSRRTASGASSC